MSWNYRIGTKVFHYDKIKGFEDHEPTRLFEMIEIYYKDGKPNGYAENINPVSNWETLEDLRGTLDLLKLASEKPIIDIDNFPDEWEQKTEES